MLITDDKYENVGDLSIKMLVFREMFQIFVDFPDANLTFKTILVFVSGYWNFPIKTFEE